MVKDFSLSLFIFHRDLRIVDNTALLKALERSIRVIPIFIFEPQLLDKPENNTNAIQFMWESLKELNQTLNQKGTRLNTFYGNPSTVLDQICKDLSVDAVFSNLDYSPYATQRDIELGRICEKYSIQYLTYADYTLTNPETIYTGSGDRYQVFTYFYKKSKQQEVKYPNVNDFENYFDENVMQEYQIDIDLMKPEPNPDLFVTGGRSNALDILNNTPHFDSYEKNRDYPSEGGTTKLSAHHKFGTISIRESYHRMKQELGKDHPLIRQLYWRDFYVYLAIHYPHVFNRSFKKKYDKISWENDKKKFQRWKEGKTGFPIVDAGMRQLNKTGYMHNRVRMIVASFLVKDLHIDWRWGERYFARKLVDYDIMVNNGNWQWAASTGADAQPYFRIFNPWTQQKKYDESTQYIRHYIPELRNLTASAIHKLDKQRPLGLDEYPSPIVNHNTRAKQAKQMFKSIE